MHNLLNNIKIQVPNQLYIKDPDTTELGRNIVQHSILMIEQLGFEAFTFRKLGEKIGSPESTIYRYFENKHMLLIYLFSWYWGWLEYRVTFNSMNIQSPQKRLLKAIETVTEEATEDGNFQHISERHLQRIIIAESSKAYLTKSVDQENKKGYFTSYQRLSNRIIEMVRDADPDFAYPKSLVSTILEGYPQQRFFGEHLPQLTDCSECSRHASEFFINMTLSMINHGK